MNGTFDTMNAINEYATLSQLTGKILNVNHEMRISGNYRFYSNYEGNFQ